MKKMQKKFGGYAKFFLLRGIKIKTRGLVLVAVF